MVQLKKSCNEASSCENSDKIDETLDNLIEQYIRDGALGMRLSDLEGNSRIIGAIFSNLEGYKYGAVSIQLDNGSNFELDGVSPSDRQSVVEGFKKQLKEQLRASAELAELMNRTISGIKDTDQNALSNDISHAIEDLLRGINLGQKQKYFGSRSYVGLTRRVPD